LSPQLYEGGGRSNYSATAADMTLLEYVPTFRGACCLLDQGGSKFQNYSSAYLPDCMVDVPEHLLL